MFGFAVKNYKKSRDLKGLLFFPYLGITIGRVTLKTKSKG
jgi:hypothetical protein